MPTERVLALGAEDNPSMFNMAHMGLRLAQRANGVSKLHGEVSRGMFGALWPGFDADEVPIGSVTNGVHGPTWAAREVARADRRSPRRTRARDGEAAVRRASCGTCATRCAAGWWTRCAAGCGRRGCSAARPCPSWAGPSTSSIPTCSRSASPAACPTYKRLTLMLRDPERLRDLLLDPQRPVQLVVAGKSHPADDGGKALIQQIVRFADDPAVRHRIVFLPDYDMSMARYLYWGCDVWLNNPLRPLEACGTSGMKSALNGGLNLSIRDGWWDELYDGRNGWAIPTADGVDDPHRRDDLEANALYELLGTQVAPAFYDADRRRAAAVGGAGAPHAGHAAAAGAGHPDGARVRRASYYAPAAGPRRRWRRRATRGRRRSPSTGPAWPRRGPGSRCSGVDASGLPDTPVVGAPMTVRAAVRLAGLDPSDVVVQAVVGRVDETDEHARRRRGRDGARRAGRRARAEERFEAVVALPFAGLTGYTVRVLPHHPLLASAAELGKVVLA